MIRLDGTSRSTPAHRAGDQSSNPGTSKIFYLEVNTFKSSRHDTRHFNLTEAFIKWKKKHTNKLWSGAAVADIKIRLDRGSTYL